MHILIYLRLVIYTSQLKPKNGFLLLEEILQKLTSKQLFSSILKKVKLS